MTNIAVGTALTFKAIVNDLNLDVYGGFNVDSDTTVVNVVEKPAEPVPPCVSVDYAIIHYNRPDGDYDGWGVYLFGPGVDESELTTWPETRPFAGEDAFGRFAFHLHFDLSPTSILESNPEHWPGRDRNAVFRNYIDPREFIAANRPRR
ncbi:MAG: hypothetical protein HC828_09695 [Blastochloris sp.]|nr:hypothetical protein [Blastochloris sp.]